MAGKQAQSGWEQLHAQATLVDIHAHPIFKALFFRRSLSKPLWAPSAWAGELNPLTVQTSFKKLHDGGVDVMLSTVYPLEKRIFKDIKVFKVIPLEAIRFLPFSLVRQVWREVVAPPYFTVTLTMLDAIEDEARQYNQKLASEGLPERKVQFAKSGAELQQLVSQPNPPIVLVHSVEGGHSLEGAVGLEHLETPWESLSSSVRQQISGEILTNLDTLAQRGVAYLILAHFYPNRLIMPTFPYPEHEALSYLSRETFEKVWNEVKLTEGLTDLGRQVVDKMLDVGMLIDVTHATPKARKDVYQIVDQRNLKRPSVIATHVGAYALNPSPYNLEDWEIQWIADHGGVIGVIFMTYWLMPNPTKFGLNFISRTIEHILNVGGEEVIGIGTDFDGADPPDDLVDSSQMPLLTQRLLAEYSGQRKYSDRQIEKILGGNALRVLLNGWGKV